MSYIITKDTINSPIIELSTEVETFESYIEPIVNIYNDLMNTNNVINLSKPQLIKIINHLSQEQNILARAKYLKSDNIGTLVNKIRSHFNLNIKEEIKN